MTRVPNKVNWGVFASYRIFMLATVAAADSASTARKNYSVFKYLVKRNHTLCTFVRYVHTDAYRRVCSTVCIHTHALETIGIACICSFPLEPYM